MPRHSYGDGIRPRPRIKNFSWIFWKEFSRPLLKDIFYKKEIDKLEKELKIKQGMTGKGMRIYKQIMKFLNLTKAKRIRRKK